MEINAYLVFMIKTKLMERNTQRLAAFYKDDHDRGIAFYVSQERIDRVPQLLDQFDFFSLRRAAIMVYPDIVIGLNDLDRRIITRFIRSFNKTKND